jgi:hypothetical protein
MERLTIIYLLSVDVDASVVSGQKQNWMNAA